MNLLILKGFNNYFNRKIKKYSDLQDYIDNSSASYRFVDINFNPNDGVATSQVIGSENQKESGVPLTWETSGSPDYVVCYETVPGTIIVDGQEVETSVDQIVSRWFVLESIRTRNGQYQLTLKRDVIADHLEAILTNPCFVEKGYVNKDNPLIFNPEAVSVNQIKMDEKMLTDETGIPWIVIYMAQNFPSSEMAGGDKPNPYYLGTSPNKFLAVTGKTVVDTGNPTNISDLPWYNIISTPDVSKTYRVPGAAELNISPIIASKHARTGTPNVYDYATRVNSRFNYSNNDWYFDNNTSNWKNIGEYSSSYGIVRVLRRRDIGLTPESNMIHWNDDGVIVPSIISSNTYSGSSTSDYGLAVFKASSKILDYMHTLKDTPSLATQWNGVKTYLNSKRTNFESNTLHSPVPGQPNMEAYVGGNQAFLPASTILSYNGIIVKSGANYYRLKITRQGNYIRQIDKFTLDGNDDIQPSATNNLKSYLLSSFSTSYDYIDYNGNPHPINVSWESNSSNTMIETFFENAWFDIQYIPANTETIRCKIMQPESNDRIHANEVAYDMICLPYGAIDFKIADGGVIYDRTSSALASLGIARAIAQAAGDAVYDMQLLPYCPYREAAREYGERLEEYTEYLEVIESGGTWVGPIPPKPYIDITNTASQTLTSGSWFKASTVDITKEDPNAAGWPNNTTPDHEKDFVDPKNKDAVTFGLWCYSTHGTFDIFNTEGIPLSDYFPSEVEDSIEAKVYSSCKKYRLVSPNYTSVFEFMPLKNKGIERFNVDFTYKPYNPYIHIAPYFKSREEGGLYGIDKNDSRGLILQGDFSVGYVSDAWAQYQIQNANYANIFNREIKNMDTNFKLDLWQNAMAGGFDAVSNSFNSASAGSNTGNPLTDALVGTNMLGKGIGGQLFGAAADAWFTGRRYREQKSFKKDLWELQLGNVKALPYGLAKSDALTENFKYFPFIEEYDCTEIEKEMFRNKLKYDGMTIDGIATLAEYLPTEEYEFQRLKGRLVMIDNITEDFQVANDINQEVQAGFYYVPAREGD